MRFGQKNRNPQGKAVAAVLGAPLRGGCGIRSGCTGANCEDTHALAPCNLEARGGEEGAGGARTSQNRAARAPAFLYYFAAGLIRHHAEQHEASSSALTNALMIPERVRSYGSHLGCMGCFHRRRNMEDASAKADNMCKALDLMGVC